MQAPQTKTPASIKYRIVASLALFPLLAACGYKGPLYMPPPPPEDSLTAPPQSDMPAPSPAPAGADSADASQGTAQTLPISGK
ncbi:LPS translocon maturation chaperone LptM [Pusillimonas noertemannii]|uniref:LPS translocon maturation chaperone LptM n=1 Tax=Pusillimonas noertemannii TaxID=305977 RepID=UPI0002F8423B|nr:lipoprotein [Pusillimonas noertemannii]